MIFLVSQNKSLFSSVVYKSISFKDALDILTPLSIVQLDTETTGLDCHTKTLLTLQLGCTYNQIVFDWTTLSLENKQQLKKYLESDRLFIGHNIGFDLTFLYKQDIWPKNIWDTMIAEQILYLGYPRVITSELVSELGVNFSMYELITEKDSRPVDKPYYELSYSLKATAYRHLNIDIDKTVRGKIINDGLTEEVIVYAAGDVMYLENIRDNQIEKLSKENLVKAVEFESECTKGVAYTKYCGIHMDTTKWLDKMARDSKELNESLEELNNYVNDLYKQDHTTYSKFMEYIYPDLFGFVEPGMHCKINWSSSQQVIPLLETLGVKVKTFDKKTRKEKKSIEKEQLKPQSDDFEIIPKFLRYQKAAKLVSTYGQNWLDAVNKETGRIHVEIHTIGTDTSRMSSGGGIYKLNLQNLPHDELTRSCFTAENGNVWLSCDYSGQESCLTASVSQDPKMCEILNTGGDLHSEVARACWPEILGNLTDKEIKAQYKDLRQDAKGVEFGVFYGGNDKTLVANKGFSKDKALKIYTNFMANFPGIKSYQDYCRYIVMEKGYILMNPIFKHRAHIFDAEWQAKVLEKTKDREYMDYYWQVKKESPHCDIVKTIQKFNKRKSETERQSINYRIQNRGACCTKLALIKFFNWIVANNYQNIVKICAIVHDEQNVECPESMKDEVSDVLVKCMIAGGKPFCPKVFLGADISCGDHWIH